MAIIKCPECEGKVSTEAKQCVHCGCTFSVCKECGEAFVGELEVCPSCGCAFDLKREKKTDKESNKSAEENNQSLDFIDKIDDEWRAEPRVKILDRIDTVFVILGFVFVALCIWKVFAFGDVTIFDLHDYLEVSGFFFYGCWLSFAISTALGDIMEIVLLSECSKWAKAKGIDLGNLIGQYLQLNFKSFSRESVLMTSGTVNKFIKAQMFEKSPQRKANMIKNKTIKICVSLAFSICFCTFVWVNVSNLLEFITLFGFESLSFEAIMECMELWWLLVVSVVLWFARKSLKASLGKQETKNIDAWVRESYPQNYNAYKKNVRGITEENWAEKIDD